MTPMKCKRERVQSRHLILKGSLSSAQCPPWKRDPERTRKAVDNQHCPSEAGGVGGSGTGHHGASRLARPTLLTPLISVVSKRSVRGFF